MIGDRQSRFRGRLLDVRGRMRKHTAAPAGAVERQPGTRRPDVRIENERAAGREHPRGLAQKRIDAWKVKGEAQGEDGIKAARRKGKTERVALCERRGIVASRFFEHRPGDVEAVDRAALGQSTCEPPCAACQVERAHEWRQQSQREVDLATVHPRAAVAAKTLLVIRLRDFGPGVEPALVLR